MSLVSHLDCTECTGAYCLLECSGLTSALLLCGVVEGRAEVAGVVSICSPAVLTRLELLSPFEKSVAIFLDLLGQFTYIER